MLQCQIQVKQFRIEPGRKKSAKLKIQSIGPGNDVVLAHSPSKLMPLNLMRITKQCPMFYHFQRA